MAKGFLTLFTAFSRDQVSAHKRRVGSEASQATLVGLCQCFCPLDLLARPGRDLVRWHSGHLTPPHASVLAGIPSCPAGTCLAKLSWKGCWAKAGEQQSR